MDIADADRLDLDTPLKTDAEFPSKGLDLHLQEAKCDKEEVSSTTQTKCDSPNSGNGRKKRRKRNRKRGQTKSQLLPVSEQNNDCVSETENNANQDYPHTAGESLEQDILIDEYRGMKTREELKDAEVDNESLPAPPVSFLTSESVPSVDQQENSPNCSFYDYSANLSCTCLEDEVVSHVDILIKPKPMIMTMTPDISGPDNSEMDSLEVAKQKLVVLQPEDIENNNYLVYSDDSNDDELLNFGNGSSSDLFVKENSAFPEDSLVVDLVIESNGEHYFCTEPTMTTRSSVLPEASTGQTINEVLREWKSQYPERTNVIQNAVEEIMVTVTARLENMHLDASNDDYIEHSQQNDKNSMDYGAKTQEMINIVPETEDGFHHSMFLQLQPRDSQNPNPFEIYDTSSLVSDHCSIASTG